MKDGPYREGPYVCEIRGAQVTVFAEGERVAETSSLSRALQALRSVERRFPLSSYVPGGARDHHLALKDGINAFLTRAEVPEVIKALVQSL